MKNKKRVLFSCIGVVTVGAVMALVGTTSNIFSHAVPYVAETKYPVVDSDASFKVYGNLKEMYKDADIVALVTVKTQNIVPVYEDVVTTQSQVEIKKVYKGDKNTKSLTISEIGGLVDYSKVTLPKKNFGENTSPQKPGIVNTAVEGSPVMQQGNTYFVLLRKNGNPKWGYNIVGTVQGKVRIDETTNNGVTTVTSDKLQNPIFFFQKQFSGKNLSEIEQQVYELN